jgi:hypothetical protein
MIPQSNHEARMNLPAFRRNTMSAQQRFATVVAIVAFAFPLAAQTSSPNGAPQIVIPSSLVPAGAVVVPASAGVASLGPTVQTSGVVARSSVLPSLAAPMPLPSEHASDGVAMMIVGGAALIVGAVIGGTSGTIFMVGGGAVGLLGLWRYMQ